MLCALVFTSGIELPMSVEEFRIVFFPSECEIKSFFNLTFVVLLHFLAYNSLMLMAQFSVAEVDILPH